MGITVDEIIRFENVSLNLGGRDILKNVSFTVKRGSTLVILGPSGAGKSSILKVMLGLWNPDEGKIFIDGNEITEMKERDVLSLRKRMGIVFQGNALFDSLTVEENIAFFLKERNSSTEQQIKDRIKQCLSFVNLSGIEKLYPSELSGGMKKRIAIARAIAFKPEILLYDEPTTGIDPINAKLITDLMKKIKLDGTTSIVVTHYVHNAVQVGDSFAVIDNGKIIQSGSLNDILKTENDFIREFFAEMYDGASLISEVK